MGVAASRTLASAAASTMSSILPPHPIMHAKKAAIRARARSYTISCMIQVRFGGAMGDVLDGTSKIIVKPRCMGEARILGRDPAHFAAAIPEMGGEEAVASWVQGTIMQTVTRAFTLLAADKGMMKAMGDIATLIQAATAPVDQELAQIGARIEFGSITINLSPEDIEALRAATAAAAQKKREQAMRPALPTMFVPGTRVLARWTDGRELGATIRNFNGTHYEIVWDGATESTFLTPDRVRPIS
jgi:hypothetical protein